jgi:3-isopropylmalate/(R)-2-methylmalate dehydratase small subunit
MVKKMKGKAWVFGGILDIDWEIIPWPETKQLRGKLDNYEEMAQYAMIKVDPDFPKKVRKGDFIVADQNVGYGHDHFIGSMALRGAGVAAVLCESAGPYFLRNSMEHGLPVLEIEGIFSGTKQDDELEVDIAAGYAKNLRSGKQFSFKPFPEFLLRIFDAGGRYPWIEQQLKSGNLRR